MEAPHGAVAVKVLRDDLARDHRHIQRLITEAEITSCLPHPNIVRFVDGGALPCRTPYVVLEFLEGESLRERLARGPIPLEETLAIARQVGAALGAAHRAGVVHRDLKPDNIFLCPGADASSPPLAKVLDFGLSTSLDGANGEVEVLGTPRYMAPEQARGRNDLVDRRTDVFALGAVVYEMLAGRPAFDAEDDARLKFQVVYEEPAPLEKIAPGLPENVVAAVHRALEKRPEDRFARVADFVEELSGAPLSFEALCLAPMRALTRALTFVTHPPVPAPGRSRWTVAAVAAIVAAAGLTLAVLGGDVLGGHASLQEAAASSARFVVP